MKKIAIIFFSFFVLFGLGACDNASDENPTVEDENPTVEIEVSEYDKLSTLEKGIFDAFIMNANDFYNPSEVRFLGFTTYSDSTKSIYVKIQGTNRLGGTLTKWYSLQVYDNTLSDGVNMYYYDKGDMSEVGDYFTINTASGVDVGKLNRALTEYWKDLGL